MHAVPERTGAALMAALERAATAAGADILTEALVRELWLDADDRVLGVGYARPDGALEHLACDVLLLACNGFGGNAAMVRELLPEMRDAVFAGHAGNDGSAIAWGRALGARLADLGGYQGHGSWAMPQGALMTWAVMMEGGVQVNARGPALPRRDAGLFRGCGACAGAAGRHRLERVRRPAAGAGAQLSRTSSRPKQAGALRTLPTRAALARLIGCDAAALHATLAAVRPARRRLRPPLPARAAGAVLRGQGHRRAVPHPGRPRHRRPTAACCAQDGTPLPNLLAAGGAARGVSGNAVWGYLSGNGLLSAVAGGWIAARHRCRHCGR